MIHIDLFSGIGGFALATEMVWSDVEHIFCDNDPFVQQVLKKHWPESPIYSDIRELIADTSSTRARVEEQNSDTQGWNTSKQSEREMVRQENGKTDAKRTLTGINPFILTGGFPCQPFSQAGRRKGTADDRYLWPEMFRVIQNTKPTWVIAENVYGLVTWNEGMVLEQTCTDLENEGYEVQPLIIPAVAVNAPHRRDRVWIIAHKQRKGRQGGSSENKGRRGLGNRDGWKERGYWQENWTEVAARLCRMDDGLSKKIFRLPNGEEITGAKWRREALKAYGNAIVPQVAAEIMRAIK